MRGWKTPCEPTLDELLGDEIMVPVMRSAGVDASTLRQLVIELARRAPAEGFRRPCGCSPAGGPRPSAA
jgi:hypothetical protein